MIHIERSAFRRGEYTALAGTAATLTRFRIQRRSYGWLASPVAWTPTGITLQSRTLRDLDAKLVEFSQ
jgi:hypothetical protein